MFASIAVGINVGMIFGVLSLLNATLTLPGIIGIVLTIGIAVDSNVLIYERIREEVRTGRTPITAIDAGFTRALATILDSNITTFIAAAVLFFIGTGPVRGFAVTLGIGIVTTVFTAFTLDPVDRGLVGEVGASAATGDFIGEAACACIPPSRLCGSSPTIPSSISCAFRRISFPASALLSIAAILLFFFHGLNFGIDFIGGTLIEVQAKSGAADLATDAKHARRTGAWRYPVAAIRRSGKRAHPGCAATRRGGGATGCACQSQTDARRPTLKFDARRSSDRGCRKSCLPTALSASCSRSSPF